MEDLGTAGPATGSGGFLVDTRLRQAYRKFTMKRQPLTETGPDPDAFARLCKALAHPVRIKIVQYLKGMDRCQCGRLVELLPLAQSTVSQHLRSLKRAGLIRGQVEGPRTCYCLDHEMLAEFLRMAARLTG
ncbi:MAG: metalloregulator ArsR/SmtB family transcription factor [Desulfobacterales bacterium]|nr:metalloregulator ArsR/SmtB family transcription factor [Desulfobacterales bacterium]